MKITNNKISMTGGASGIGLGIAEEFIKETTLLSFAEDVKQH